MARRELDGFFAESSGTHEPWATRGDATTFQGRSPSIAHAMEMEMQPTVKCTDCGYDENSFNEMFCRNCALVLCHGHLEERLRHQRVQDPDE